MRCRDAEQLMGEPFGADLDEGMRDALAEHLAHCPRCASMAERIAAVRGALAVARAQEPPVPVGLADRIRAAAAHTQRQSRPSHPVHLTPTLLGAGGALALAAASLYIFVLHTPTLQPALPTPTSPTTIASQPAQTLPPTPAKTTAPAPKAPTVAVAQAPLPPVKALSAAPVRLVKHASARRVASSTRTTRAQVSADRPQPATKLEEPVPAVKEGTLLASASGAAGRPSAYSGTMVAATPSAAATRQPTEADRGMVASLIAGYVVERYVAERIIQSEPTLLAVTTSIPSSSQTAVTDVPPR